MTSPRKLAANRQNALRSTGPRTAVGKARSARNKRPIHGLFAREALLATENRRDFDRLAEDYREDCNPVGAREEFLVGVMIVAEWKERRLLRMEADILSWNPTQHPIGSGIEIYEAHHFDDQVTEVKHFCIPDNHRGPKHPPDDADKGSVTAEETPLPIGLAFLRGCIGTDAFAALSRYGTANEKSYYKAAQELQRLQHARLSGHVPAPPLAVHLTVDAGAEGRPDNATTAPDALDTRAEESARP